MEYLICITWNHKVAIFYVLWHPLWQHWPVVRHSEPSHRDVVTLGAELQKHEEVCQEGGGEGQLSSRHKTQFVPLHQQPAEEDPHRHSWQVQHTWSKNVEQDYWWNNTFLQDLGVLTSVFLISKFIQCKCSGMIMICVPEDAEKLKVITCRESRSDLGNMKDRHI